MVSTVFQDRMHIWLGKFRHQAVLAWRPRYAAARRAFARSRLQASAADPRRSAPRVFGARSHRRSSRATHSPHIRGSERTHPHLPPRGGGNSGVAHGGTHVPAPRRTRTHDLRYRSAVPRERACRPRRPRIASRLPDHGFGFDRRHRAPSRIARGRACAQPCPSPASGQGGYITNWHHVLYDTADAYIPFMAGAAPAEPFLSTLPTAPAVRRDATRLREMLNFDGQWSNRAQGESLSRSSAAPTSSIPSNARPARTARHPSRSGGRATSPPPSSRTACARRSSSILAAATLT